MARQVVYFERCGTARHGAVICLAGNDEVYAFKQRRQALALLVQESDKAREARVKLFESEIAQLAAEMDYRHSEEVLAICTKSGPSYEGPKLPIDDQDLYDSEIEEHEAFLKHFITDKNEKQTGQASSSKGPILADARKSKSLGELNGIPILNLGDVVEAPGPFGWSMRKGGKDIPIMEPITEEAEPVDMLQFSQADIHNEVEFWKKYVYCYILGANPPWEIIEDYVYQVWQEFKIDRVSFMDNGIFLVRLQSSECKEALLSSGYYMFDNKPIVIKPWNVDVELVKAKVDVVPVLIKMAGIPLKFWGDCLPKIAGLVGKFVNKDKATEDRVRLSQARVMAELQVDQALPDKVKFLDETGKVVEVRVEYEWLPVTCSLCKGMGHVKEKCRKSTQKPRVKAVQNKPQKVWRPVQKAQVTPPVTEPQNQLFTPEVFPPLVRTVKSTPARTIMRMNKQGGPVGARGTGSVGPFTFIEALNKLATPKESNFLKNVAGSCSLPWLWLGYFNTVLSPVERLGGNSTKVEMEQFQDCVSICCMEDVQATGALFTWSNKQDPVDRVYSRLDRAMGNLEWVEEFDDYWAHFHPPGLFDHSPCTLSDRKSGLQVVLLENIQKELVNKPGNTDLMQQEHDVAQELKELLAARDNFLVQKAKIQWSLEGDINTAFFHNSIRKRMIQNKVLSIEDQNGIVCTDGEQIQQAVLSYYMELLGSQTSTVPVNVHVVRRGKCCTESHWEALNRPVTADEVKKALFSIPKDKSPGLDGYTSQFFRDSWDLTGGDVTAAILNFFATGKLLNEMNATLITLIPKVDRPVSVKHFRPIACCNVIYQTISKILCSRVAGILPDIISNNKGAFVQGKSILENILICQDLKAYDTIEWGFLDQMLSALNFPEKTRQLIMTCVTSTSFSLNLNGALFGYFKGKRGLRQGDPISLLLFTICMEYLTRVLDYATYKWTFRFHPLCKVLRLNHLLFADDLLLFCKGDTQSIMLLLRAFSTFSATSGLKVNAAKSKVVFRGVPESMRAEILQISCFKEGDLPFKYLWIPIQAGRLTKLDSNILVERVVARIRSIGARKLSYAGRLTLVNSVLNTLHNYWGSIFLIPKAVRAPLIAWDRVCCRKQEGGLGVIKGENWNIASVGKLVNLLYTNADRLWVQWVHHIYLKDQEWHNYVPPTDSNWNWRNICKVKGLMSSGYVNNHWIHDPKGYSIKSGYGLLQGGHPSVGWYKDVWDAWCKYGEQIKNQLEQWLQIQLDPNCMGIYMLQQRVCRMALAAFWCCLWIERNSCRMEQRLKCPERLVQEIKRLLRARIQLKLAGGVRLQDKNWLQKLDIIV
ncbi:uncharacterized protein LOC141620164 [Silene latifolia]|uniref:uncharacterized protein LOC141620164 n=1 Tax=Silene latifolia TaxID=37657 RepID=UPI003D77F601